MSSFDPPLYAAIDLGSNTIRLLIAGVAPDGRGITVHYSRREVTRLGAGLGESGSLAREAVEQSRAIVRDYIREAAGYGVAWIVAVGTAALRDAREGRQFSRTLQQCTGLKLNIIDQQTEALLSNLGASLVAGDERRLVVVDVGGRTTEIACQRKNAPPEILGLPLGALRLTDGFISSDPPDPSEIDGLLRHVRVILDGYPQLGQLPDGSVLVGTGGTFTALAALEMGLIEYDRERINGYILEAKRIEATVRTLSSATLDERAALPGMEPGREDIIVAGAVLVSALMERFSRQSVMVSDSGILEGCILACLVGNPALDRSEFRNIKTNSPDYS